MAEFDIMLMSTEELQAEYKRIESELDKRIESDAIKVAQKMIEEERDEITNVTFERDYLNPSGGMTVTIEFNGGA